MRCPGWTREKLPADMQQRMMLIRVQNSDARRMQACMISLMQAAQARGLLERVAHRHRFYHLSQLNLGKIGLAHMGVAAIADAGSAIAASVPGGDYHGSRIHVYQGGSAGMAAHHDSRAGSAHPFLLPHINVLVPACALKLA